MDMVNLAICDQGLVEAKNVPSQCFSTPGACPPGLYHTFFRHDDYVGLLDVRLRYFASQLIATGIEPATFEKRLFNADLLHKMLEREDLLSRPARLRMMVFDSPVKLLDGASTACMAFARAEESEQSESAPFRCAVSRRRRLDITDAWELKRLGRAVIDNDLADARSRGFDEILYLDRQENWCEASYSNIVAVFGNRVCVIAPPGLAYRGITATAMSLIKSELKPLQFHDVSVGAREIARADEVFLTSAVRGLQPVTEIEGIGSWPADTAGSIRSRIAGKMKENGLI